MVEQRDVTERELRVEECDECHVAPIIRGRPATRSPWLRSLTKDSLRGRLPMDGVTVRACWLREQGNPRAQCFIAVAMPTSKNGIYSWARLEAHYVLQQTGPQGRFVKVEKKVPRP